MRLMRILAAVAMLIVAGFVHPPRASAQQSPEALAAANDLFALMSTDMLAQLNTQVSAQLWPIIDRDLKSRGVDEATSAEIRKELERIQLEQLTESMKGVPAIYARYFTAAELHDIAAFYKTPTGAKTLRLMPAVMAEAMQAMVPQMQKIQWKTQGALLRVLRQRGYLK